MSQVIGKVITSTREGHTAIGKANEDFEGIVENNSRQPDKNGVEYKIHDAGSSSAITLFTASPSYPRKINSIIRNNYGKLDEEYNIKTIHMSLHTNSITIFNDTKFYTFLKNDRVNVMVDDMEFHWSFVDLFQKTTLKLQSLSYREAHKISNTVFKIEKEEIYDGFNFDNFINLMESQDIFIDIRMGIDRKNRKPHDHGTAFRITPSKLSQLYDGNTLYKPVTLDNFIRKNDVRLSTSNCT